MNNFYMSHAYKKIKDFRMKGVPGMKKAITLSALAVFAMCVLAVPGNAQTAEEILSKMVDAQGGRAIFM